MYRRCLTLLSCILTAGVLVANPVQAGVLATAVVDLSDFEFLGSDGVRLDYNTDFFSDPPNPPTLTFTSSADEDATLGAETKALSSGATPIDLPVICVPNGLEGCEVIPENVFPVLSGAPSENYSTADQFETGAPIDNLPGFDAPARVAQGSYVGIDIGSTDGSVDTNNNLNSSFIFSLAQAQGVTIRFNARAYLEAFVSGGELFPSFATAAYAVLFTLTDLSTGDVVFSWAPDGAEGNIVGGTENSDPFSLNSTVSLNAPLPMAISNTGGVHTEGVASEGLFSATTNPLEAGRLYQFSARNDANVDALRVDVPVVSDACRLTGGGVSVDTTTDGQDFLVWDGESLVDAEDYEFNRYQFGGQVGANTALPPSPKGEWQHHQQSGPAGKFSFHGGTASAPDGTEIVEIRCSDTGGCSPSGNPPSPNKQLDFDGIGTFKNIGSGRNNAPEWLIPDATVTAEGRGNQAFDGTFHWFEVNVDDLGEGPDPAEGDDAACPPEGFGEKGVDIEPANCDCPDFYRITIYDGVDAADVAWIDGKIDPSSLNTTDVIYEVEGYLGLGGNGLQLHTLTGFDRK